MFWDAIIQGFKGPCHVWEEDSVEDKRHFQEIVNEENQIRHQRQEFNQQQAQFPTSWQYEALTNLNSMIENLNKEEGRSGRHKRRKRKAEQLFKEKELEFTSKGGINWVSYRERVLRPKLYPWMESLRKTLGVPYLYLVEDNAPSHQTARRIDEDECLSHGILTLNWPSKSPDLNQIEPIGTMKRMKSLPGSLWGLVSRQLREQRRCLLGLGKSFHRLWSIKSVNHFMRSLKASYFMVGIIISMVRIIWIDDSQILELDFGDSFPIPYMIINYVTCYWSGDDFSMWVSKSNSAARVLEYQYTNWNSIRCLFSY